MKIRQIIGIIIAAAIVVAGAVLAYREYTRPCSLCLDKGEYDCLTCVDGKCTYCGGDGICEDEFGEYTCIMCSGDLVCDRCGGTGVHECTSCEE